MDDDEPIHHHAHSPGFAASGPAASKLAAIAFADIAGYSRHVARDSVRAVAGWRSLRTDLMAPLLERYGGRIVGSGGDSIFAEFDSVVRAVEWALEVQRANRVGGEDDHKAPPMRMRMRIAVNVDEVIYDDGVPQSDGVNIAARIHQLAAPGEVVVTGIARELIGNHLPLTFHDLGTPRLKNIDRSVRAFVVRRRDGTDLADPLPYRDWASRPTIAVMPLRPVGGPPEGRYFGEGITEDIVNGLSRSRSLFVVARSSTLRFGDGDIDPSVAGNALGVKYVLTGTVRRLSRRLRISVELVDVDLTRAIWSDSFDGADVDLFDFQDQIVASIVARLEPHVQKAETARISGRPTDSLDAYDCVLRALWHLYRFTAEDHLAARRLIEQAITTDPGYAQAHAYSAWLLNFWIGEGFSTDVPGDRARAVASAQMAMELDPDDAFCLSVRGHLKAFIEGRPEEGIELLERAVAINPNAPLAWALNANARAYLGDGDAAAERLCNVWRLSPFDPLNFIFWTAAGIAYFTLGRLEEAAKWCGMANMSKPRYLGALRIRCAALGLLGREEEARLAADEILSVEPRFRVSEFIAWYPLQRGEDRARLAEGLLRAGLPN